MPRRLLIINESHLLRKIVTSYVQVELADVIIETAWYADDALRTLQEKKFDVILASLDLAPMDGIEIFQRLRREPGPNSRTPFIIMAAVATPELRDRLRQADITHFVFAPYTADDLARAINDASDPKVNRRHDRCSIEGGRAEIDFGRTAVLMDVLNISRRGMSTEFPYWDDNVIPWRAGSVVVSLPDGDGVARMAGITAVATRIWVIGWESEDVPQTMRAAWKFIQVPDSAADLLGRILERAPQSPCGPEDLDVETGIENGA